MVSKGTPPSPLRKGNKARFVAVVSVWIIFGAVQWEELGVGWGLGLLEQEEHVGFQTRFVFLVGSLLECFLMIAF